MSQRRNKLPFWAIITGLGVLGFTAILTIAIGVVIFIMANGNDTTPHSASTAGTSPVWSAYFYDQQNHRLIQVKEDSSKNLVNLPQYSANGFNGVASVGVGGQIAAYCATVAENGVYSQFLHIANVQTGNLLHSHPIDINMAAEQTGECRVSSKSVNAEGTTVAVAVLRGANPATWRLLIMDAQSGSILNELNNESAGIGENENERFYFMPDVRLYQDNEIAFALIPWGTEGFPVDTGYEWDLLTNTVQQTPAWGSMILDYLPASQELAWIEADSNFPAGEPGGPLPSFNVVRVQDTDGNITTVYHSVEFLPIQVKFINNGQALAIQVLATFDPANDNPSGQFTKWMSLDRNGTMTDLRETTGVYVQLMPFNASPAFLVQHNTTEPLTTLEVMENDTNRIVWKSDFAGWVIVGVTPFNVDADALSAFTAIN